MGQQHVATLGTQPCVMSLGRRSFPAPAKRPLLRPPRLNSLQARSISEPGVSLTYLTGRETGGACIEAAFEPDIALPRPPAGCPKYRVL